MGNDTPQPLRVLQFGRTVGGGGVATAIVDLCLGLAREGHEVGLLCNGGEDLRRLEGSGVEVFPARFVGGTRGVLREVVPTARVLRGFRPDIVHVHGRGQSLVTALAGRYPDCFTLHNASFTEVVGSYDSGVIRRGFSPVGRKVIALNAEAHAYVRGEMRIPEARIATIPNGVDVARFVPAEPDRRAALRADFGVGPEELMVLFVGRFHPQKQPEAVLALAEACRDRGHDHVRVVMLGKGVLQADLEARLSAAGLGDRVSLLSYRDPLEAYQAADLVVMPSRYEGFGLVAAEAMAAGAAVLRTRTGGFSAMIEDGETGFGCEIDPEDFVARGLALVERPEEIARVRVAARQKAVADLSLTAQVRRTAALYDELMQERGRRAA